VGEHVLAEVLDDVRAEVRRRGVERAGPFGALLDVDATESMRGRHVVAVAAAGVLRPGGAHDLAGSLGPGDADAPALLADPQRGFVGVPALLIREEDAHVFLLRGMPRKDSSMLAAASLVRPAAMGSLPEGPPGAPWSSSSSR
jgi:hypothetical protein